MKWESVSGVWPLATPWTVACQAPLSMKFSRQEYWSGYPFPSPGDLPNSRIELRSPTLQVDSLPSETLGKPMVFGIKVVKKITHIPIMHVCVLSHFSRVWLFVPPWTVACQAPLFMWFSSQEYWGGLPFSPPGDLPDIGIEPAGIDPGIS